MGVYIELPKDWAKWSLEVTDVHDNILEAKTTDIDLVRCRECVWYNPWHANHTNIDGNHCRNIDRPMKPTDFCSYGERRSDGHI